MGGKQSACQKQSLSAQVGQKEKEQTNKTVLTVQFVRGGHSRQEEEVEVEVEITGE